MSSSVITLREVDAAEKWQQILADLVTDPKELLQILELDPRELNIDGRVLSDFPLKVPRPFLSRIEKGNWHDPLLKQVLPLNSEVFDAAPGLSLDPLNESEYNPEPGLLHKYKGRVLLTVAPHCAVHCRYCFRRHFDYSANSPSRHAWQKVIDYIAKDPTITEVIYSGGDPLAASDRHLAWLTNELEAVPHLQRLRIHTRTPIMIPPRVTDSLVQWLDRSRFKIIIVLHTNHANEIDSQVARALDKLTAIGVILFNQSVLLKDINDTSSILCDLSEVLFSVNVMPYYLHLLDPVPGVTHFNVSHSRGQQLISEMASRLPGYLVPKLVKEEAGELSKSRIA